MNDAGSILASSLPQRKCRFFGLPRCCSINPHSIQRHAAKIQSPGAYIHIVGTDTDLGAPACIQ